MQIAPETGSSVLKPVSQLQAYQDIANSVAQLQASNVLGATPSPAPTHTSAPAHSGLPAQLQSGIESLSGIAMHDVRVHYNSDKPAQLQAHAYAQGTDIHLAAGQEKHLPHEAWHVVQQKQGRVKPTLQLKGIAVNDDSRLEREADEMGARAMATKSLQGDRPLHHVSLAAKAPAQRVILSKVFTKLKSAGGGFLHQYYSTLDASQMFDTFEKAQAFEAKLQARVNPYNERYPTNFSYYNQPATSVSQGDWGPHSLSHSSLAYRFERATRGMDAKRIPDIRNIISQQIPSIEVFKALLDVEKPGKFKADQYERMVLDYTLLFRQLEHLLSSAANFNLSLVQEIMMRLMQMNPYTTYNKGKTTGKRNIKNHGEREDVTFDRAFDGGAVRSFRDADGYEEFKHQRAMLWPKNELVEADANAEDTDEELDDREMKHKGSMSKQIDEDEPSFDPSTTAAPAVSAAAAAAATATTAAKGSAGNSAGNANKKGKSHHSSSSMQAAFDQLTIEAEDEVDEDILNSVKFEMGRSALGLQGSLLVVTGEDWTCYIRCVLHALGKIAQYDAVMLDLASANLNLGQGVQIGTVAETAIQGIIERITGQQYYVNAVDAKSADNDRTVLRHGTCVNIVVTGAHFSLWR